MGIRLHFALVPVQLYQALDMTPAELELVLLLDKMEDLRWGRSFENDPAYTIFNAIGRIEEEMETLSRYRHLVGGEIGKCYPHPDVAPPDFWKVMNEKHGYASDDPELVVEMINQAHSDGYIDSVEWFVLTALYKADPSSVKMYWC